MKWAFVEELGMAASCGSGPSQSTITPCIARYSKRGVVLKCGVASVHRLSGGRANAAILSYVDDRL